MNQKSYRNLLDRRKLPTLSFSLLKRILFLVFNICISGCNTSFVVKDDLMQNTFFSTNEKVSKSEILAFNPISNLDQYNFTIVIIEENLIGQKYENYISFLLKKAGFSNLTSQDEFQHLVVSTGAYKLIPHLKSIEDFNKLSQYTGPFLIVVPNLITKSGYANFELKVLDPTNLELLFHVKKAGTNWSGFDQPFVYPVLNKLIEWRNQSSSKTDEKKLKTAI